jgi:CheY-like chemotaxis protein
MAELGRPAAEAYVRLHAGRQLSARRRLVEARQQLAAAARVADQIGATAWRDEANSLLADASAAAQISGLALRTDGRSDGRLPVVTTVLIVDDHAGFRSRARSLLESEGFTVVGEAADGSSAVTGAQALRPDLVLLDVMLPDMTGFVVAEQLLGIAPPPVVVFVSSREATDFGTLVGESQASGFISKGDLTGSRLREVLAGSL